MHKPRFLDQLAIDLGDREAFTSAFARGRRAFQPEHVEPKWARDRAANISHIKLEVALDFEARNQSPAPRRIGCPQSPARWSASSSTPPNSTISAVRAGRRARDLRDLRWQAADNAAAGSQSRRGSRDRDRLRGQPRRGLYFVGPDAAYPNKPVEAWTQGEDEDSRYWFPCYDYPNNRTTSEVIATVPEKFTAISNGALIATTANAAGEDADLSLAP